MSEEMSESIIKMSGKVSNKESAPFYREITENEVYRHLEHGSKIKYPFSKTAKNYRNPGYGNSMTRRQIIIAP